MNDWILLCEYERFELDLIMTDTHHNCSLFKDIVDFK